MEEKDNLEVAMQAYLRHYPAFTAGELDPTQLAQWGWDECVFSFLCAGQDYYPAFQFDAQRQPLPGMQHILPVLASRLTNWQIALWFTTASPALENRCPADLLATRPQDVWQAAQRISGKP